VPNASSARDLTSRKPQLLFSFADERGASVGGIPLVRPAAGTVFRTGKSDLRTREPCTASHIPRYTGHGIEHHDQKDKRKRKKQDKVPAAYVMSAK